jgi:hypothetical protein
LRRVDKPGAIRQSAGFAEDFGAIHRRDEPACKELIMGRGDVRRSLKMRRRKSQKKKKARIKRKIEAGKAGKSK